MRNLPACIAILAVATASTFDFPVSMGLANEATSSAESPTDTTASDSGGRAAYKALKLPGLDLNLKERCVDVESTVCLDEGMLELVACTKDTKEHESIVVINAKAIHIHTALLLLGAKSGNPAMRKRVGEGEEEHWIDAPPKGGPVEVFLVVANKKGNPVERPISDFIEPADPAGAASGAGDERARKERFPTRTFLFAGSHLVAEGKGPRTYVCDRSGNVISVATFGDEMLCLPEIHSHENGALHWQIDSTHLPEVGTKVTLRLRPQLDDAKKHP